MLFLPAAALSCLCSALVATATLLLQQDLTLTRRVGETVSFSCGGTDQCGDNYVYWFQYKESLTLILGFNRDRGTVYSDFSHPQKNDFSAARKLNSCELLIRKTFMKEQSEKRWTELQVFAAVCVTVEGAGESDKFLVFGSGTKMFVTGRREPVLRPQVVVYPAASSARLRGRNLLLCAASDMSPPLVRFSWKRQRENGPWDELPPGRGEQLQLRAGGRVVAIRDVEQDAEFTYNYRCRVEHESGTAEAPRDQEVAALPPPAANSSASCEEQDDWHREKRLCLTYTLLVAKSLVYGAGLGLIRVCGRETR